MKWQTSTSLQSDQARRLVHLASLPSVVMDKEERAALLAGAAALEREHRRRAETTVRVPR